METIKLNSSLVIRDVEHFIHSYGLRSYNLLKLLKHSQDLGYKVPTSILISSDLSIEISKYFYNLDSSMIKSQSYLQANNIRFKSYCDYLSNKGKELIEIAKSVNNGNSPIIRGTSCAEGYKNLSFAGVCHSSIPKKDLSFEENVINGTARVLSSVYSPYAQYYFNSHGIPEIGKNVGIIMMEMLDKPIFHVTAYVYASEVRIKYFSTPETGTVYKGGRDIILSFENYGGLLKAEFGEYESVWKHTINVLHALSSTLHGNKNLPIDVEFLITDNGKNFDLNIVQIRNLSDVHFKNYTLGKNFFPVDVDSPQDILIGKSHLYHSVTDCFGKISFSETFHENSIGKYVQIFIVKHQLGEGLFSFLDSLPRVLTRKVGLIITHSSERSHDHLQYSIYEDERIEFVVHVNEDFTSSLKDGMIVHMISNGNEAVIKEVNEFSIENVNIRFIDENSLPDASIVSAVFLIGFIDNSIIAVRNERGWDIPGGHVETADSNLIDSLKREVDEESGAVVNNVKPYAVVQFEGKDKVMLFYTSNDCKLIEFVPKEDAFERKLMTVPEFISEYNWKKDIIELLIKRALQVL